MSPATPDLPFERHTLDNGLRIVLHRNATLPLVAVNLWYHVGSKNERLGRTGFAHLFEHMLFQGSDHVGTPDHWPVIGYMDDIAAATLEEVRDFFRTYYTPSNAVLTLAGDIDPDAALERAE